MSYYDMVRDIYKEEDPLSEDVPAISVPNTLEEWIVMTPGVRPNHAQLESVFDTLPGPSMIAVPYIKSGKGSFRERPEHITQHRVRIGRPQDSDGAWLGLTFEKTSWDCTWTPDGQETNFNEVVFRLSREEAETLIENLRKQLG